jgi:hypothetical protein
MQPPEQIPVPAICRIDLIDNIVKFLVREVQDPFSRGQVDAADMLGAAVAIPDCTVKQVTVLPTEAAAFTPYTQNLLDCRFCQLFRRHVGTQCT